MFQKHMCMQCNEAITNPICQFCLAEEIKNWANGKDERLKRILFEELRSTLKPGDKKYSKCAVCNKNNGLLCPYCFTEQIYSKMVEERINWREILEFLILFDFDSNHSGYYQVRERIEELSV